MITTHPCAYIAVTVPLLVVGLVAIILLTCEIIREWKEYKHDKQDKQDQNRTTSDLHRWPDDRARGFQPTGVLRGGVVPSQPVWRAERSRHSTAS